jgi:hypothetical protein
MFDILCAPLLSAAADASRQVRSTKHALGLPSARGLIIIANLADQRLNPKTDYHFLTYVLGRHINTFHSYVFLSPTSASHYPTVVTHLLDEW